jgi:hypothetical protein
MNKNPIIHRRPKMRKTDLYLTDIQHDKILEIATNKGITFSEMFRQIVDRYLENYEKR